jgi:hypothetical protein
MNKDERLHLQRMIKENNVVETTDQIRSLKHSSLIKAEVEKYLTFKKRYTRLYNTNPEQFKQMSRNHCPFLYKNYMNLFERLVKEELNLQILALLLATLKRIEDGEINQHEGSYDVGKVLKKLYVDSALRRESKREKRKKKKQKRRTKKITWEEFKKLKL